MMDEMLEQVAAANGEPGALGAVNIGPLIVAGYVTFGYTPSLDGSPPTYANAWVKLTDAGRAALDKDPT